MKRKSIESNAGWPVLMVQLHPSTFVKRDEQILRSLGPVKVFTFRRQKGRALLIELIRQKLFLLRNIWSCRVIYIWFADFHAVLPALFARLTGRKCVIVIGGVDAAYLPEYHYGTKTRLIGRISLYMSLRLAHLLLPVSEFTLNDLRRNISENLVRKALVVHNCYTPERQALPGHGNRNVVLSIALASTQRIMFIKGIDIFLAAAAKMPEQRFMVVGLSSEAMKEAQRLASANVTLLGPVSFNNLQEIYRQTIAICQFSRQESFGIALLEGLAAGCVPVIANRCGPAEVFADTGVPAINQMDADEAVLAIRSALRMEPEKLTWIQQKVLDAFHCNVRKEKLRAAITKLANQ
jgi:glycosyltransferase involved in cell wall biosynthesis